MNQKDIEKALNARMTEYQTAYPIDIVYPNTDYTPTIGTPFLQVFFLHGDTTQVEIGTDSDDRAPGIYQVNLNVQSNEGSGEATTIITQLKEYFKRGTIASYNGLNVRITSFNIGSNASDGDWYREVINIVFRADISN